MKIQSRLSLFERYLPRNVATSAGTVPDRMWRLLVACVPAIVITIFGITGMVAYLLIDRAIDRALPTQGGDRMYRVLLGEPPLRGRIRAKDVAYWQTHNRSGTSVGVFGTRQETVRLSEEKAASLVSVATMSAEMLAMLEDAYDGQAVSENGTQVAIVSDRVAEQLRRHPQFTTHVVGRTVWIGSDPYTIGGTMAPGFRFPFNEDVWLVDELRDWEIDEVVARVRPGMTVSSVAEELERLHSRRVGNDKVRVDLVPFTSERPLQMPSWVSGTMATAATILLVGAGFVLADVLRRRLAVNSVLRGDDFGTKGHATALLGKVAALVGAGVIVAALLAAALAGEVGSKSWEYFWIKGDVGLIYVVGYSIVLGLTMIILGLLGTMGHRRNHKRTGAFWLILAVLKDVAIASVAMVSLLLGLEDMVSEKQNQSSMTSLFVADVRFMGAKFWDPEHRRLSLEEILGEVRSNPVVDTVAATDSIPMQAGLPIVLDARQSVTASNSQSAQVAFVSSDFFSLFELSVLEGTVFAGDDEVAAVISASIGDKVEDGSTVGLPFAESVGSGVYAADSLPIVGMISSVVEHRARQGANPRQVFAPIGLIDPFRFFLILRYDAAEADVIRAIDTAVSRQGPGVAIAAHGVLGELAENAGSVKEGLAHLAMVCGLFGMGLYYVGLYTSGGLMTARRIAAIRADVTGPSLSSIPKRVATSAVLFACPGALSASALVRIVGEPLAPILSYSLISLLFLSAACTVILGCFVTWRHVTSRGMLIQSEIKNALYVGRSAD